MPTIRPKAFRQDPGVLRPADGDMVDAAAKRSAKKDIPQKDLSAKRAAAMGQPREDLVGCRANPRKTIKADDVGGEPKA